MTYVLVFATITLYPVANSEYKNWNKKRLVKEHNVIVINGNVNLQDFQSQWRQVDKDRPINLVIESPGGSLGDMHAICNILMNSNCKLQCYIRHYASSAALYIALNCDTITCDNYAFFSPCDPMWIDEPLIHLSDPTLFQKQKNVTNIICHLNAKKVLCHHNNYVDKFFAFKYKWNEATKQKVRHELFSGENHAHENYISPLELQNICGQEQVVIEDLPSWILDV